MRLAYSYVMQLVIHAYSSTPVQLKPVEKDDYHVMIPAVVKQYWNVFP